MLPYSGPDSACPKCHVVGKMYTQYHPKPETFCSVGFRCIGRYTAKEEHFLRTCQNCSFQCVEAVVPAGAKS